ncbi:phosphoribosylaminoimidazole carboxylase ade2 [Actinomortierella ambigua]|uniref:Phosphoribosylaminoimidazole carboxylase n=1 Tax=Actinomortierella ambigua TaxID=1343610 RepID=A0A9P6PVY4_9FUNG|nr:phosphoribosylaminoimidazole carboxylase ade2 [Actinomortierella ambigua]
MASLESRKIGILGGGQLGRMAQEAASRLNISLTILDQPVDAPAKQINAIQPHIQGAFTDADKIRELANSVDVITVEIEHVDTAVLFELEKQGKEIHPTPGTIHLIQDKYEQKVHLAKHGIPMADALDCPDDASIQDAGQRFGFPFMLKSKTGAYDGRGNYVVRSSKDVADARSHLAPGAPLYAEKWAKFDRELAVMVVRSVTGEVQSYPVVETVHKNSICHLVFAPAQVGRGLTGTKDATFAHSIAERARKVAEDAVASLAGAGVFGVEMFLMDNGEILLNEIAPRPHNSGHYTIEACHTSQYENHLRAILGLPLGSTAMKVPAAGMLNILGNGDRTYLACEMAYSIAGATTHLYGKKECKQGRKMGHITVVGDSMQQVHSRLLPMVCALDPADQSPWNLDPLVSIVMGSDSDLKVMEAAAQVLTKIGVPFELSLVSAHRTPERMYHFGRMAHKRGVKVIIAGAGGAAHLPGMVAALTPLPVIGVPVRGSVLDGVDSLHSIVQMPRGVPVATVAINNSTNAALLAVRILGSSDPAYLEKMTVFMEEQEKEVLAKIDNLDEVGWANYEVKKH